MAFQASSLVSYQSPYVETVSKFEYCHTMSWHHLAEEPFGVAATEQLGSASPDQQTRYSVLETDIRLQIHHIVLLVVRWLPVLDNCLCTFSEARGTDYMLFTANRRVGGSGAPMGVHWGSASTRPSGAAIDRPDRTPAGVVPPW